MEKQKPDFNSVENQEIKSQFVKREVLTCFSYEMDAVLKASSDWAEKENPLPSWDDIENLFTDTCPECGYDGESDIHHNCPECKDKQIEMESTPAEIFEWWIVTEYLYNKLKAKGQPVLEWGNNCYWGRCTTGQAIMLDHVISEICSDMEILDGQKYSWAKTK